MRDLRLVGWLLLVVGCGSEEPTGPVSPPPPADTGRDVDYAVSDDGQYRGVGSDGTDHGDRQRPEQRDNERGGGHMGDIGRGDSNGLFFGPGDLGRQRISDDHGIFWLGERNRECNCGTSGLEPRVVGFGAHVFRIGGHDTTHR